VRPDHLVPGTHHDNTQDRRDRGRMPLGDDHWTRQRGIRYGSK
jgi:hypothetical protein